MKMLRKMREEDLGEWEAVGRREATCGKREFGARNRVKARVGVGADFPHEQKWTVRQEPKS